VVKGRGLRMALEPEAVASKVKVVKYGAASGSPDSMVEVGDRSYREIGASVQVTRVGGIGLDLEEYNVGEDCATVLVFGVNSGSNAEAAGGFQKGDILVGITGVEAIEGTETEASLNAGEAPLKAKLEGLTLDKTLDLMSYFGEYKSVSIRVKRIIPRKVVKVKVIGPQGEDQGELQVLSGYGVNMRTLLQASSKQVYDRRSYRFDSPYQNDSNCGGEGTCGTCIVSVLSGAENLNERNRVENAALLKQNAPPNYRWSCRAYIAENPDEEGASNEIVVKLRPQTTSWDV
jgi:ferredoxin